MTRNFFLKGRRTCAPGSRNVWWSQTGSNRRPHACKARALPTELWPQCWNRSCPKRLVGLGRLELPTSRLSSARSNQLSYKPKRIARPCGGGVAHKLFFQKPSFLQLDARRAGSSFKEERETKTAAVPHDRPDWPLCSEEIR
jgi:hypothetical protein